MEKSHNCPLDLRMRVSFNFGCSSFRKNDGFCVWIEEDVGRSGGDDDKLCPQERGGWVSDRGGRHGT